MNIVPTPLKPAAHCILDRILALFKLHLPRDINLKSKLRYLIKGIDEKDLLFAIKSYVKPGDCVIDVGANIGLTVRWFSRAVGNEGRVYAIEPERSNFTYMCANNISQSNVRPHMLAFSANNEIRNLLLNPVSGSGNSFYGDSSFETQKIRCLTFDSFCEQEQIVKVDWIKIDVEGAELDVLEGMSETLAKNPHCKVLIEYCPENLKCAGSSGSQLMSKLHEIGLQTYAIVKHQNQYHVELTMNPSDLLGKRNYLNLICSKEKL